MKRKRFNHQVETLCQIFCGWRLVNSHDHLTKLGSGEIRIDLLKKQAFFNGQLLNVYRENETLGRAASRVKVQIEGSLKSLFDAGNSLKDKVGVVRSVDDAIIRLYGMDPVAAREKSGRLKPP